MPKFPPPIEYDRVLPRDLFNEGNLLKCWGRLELLTMDDHDDLAIRHTCPEMGFSIRQNQLDGSLEVINLKLLIHQKPYRVFRPLNSRDDYPLWIETDTESNQDMPIFDDDGNLTDEFLGFVESTRPVD